MEYTNYCDAKTRGKESTDAMGDAYDAAFKDFATFGNRCPKFIHGRFKPSFDEAFYKYMFSVVLL